MNKTYKGGTAALAAVLLAAYLLPIGLMGCSPDDSPVSVTGVSLVRALTLRVGAASQALTHTVLPANATDKTVSWGSSDETVATVADGVVTAVGKGSATITVAATDGGSSADCAVGVIPPKLPGSPDVYVAGFEIKENGTRTATVWKNGNNLTDGTKSVEAYSVYVSGSDVYAAGYESTGTMVAPIVGGGTMGGTMGNEGWEIATVWKNSDTAIRLTNGKQASRAFSVYVSGGDVYVAGWEQNNSGISVATVWKNSTEITRLTTGEQHAEAKSVYVSGGDVYAAGYEETDAGKKVAMVWKNSDPAIPLTGSTNYATAVVSVYVSGSIVYAAGSETDDSGKSVATVWIIINGGVTKIPLSDVTKYAGAQSVYVSGSDVYVAGYENTEGMDVAMVWRINGGVTKTSLSDGTRNAIATSVYVSGSDVYVSGYERNATGYYAGYQVATVWKNSTKITPPLTGGKQDAIAYSVFVVVP